MSLAALSVVEGLGRWQSAIPVHGQFIWIALTHRYPGNLKSFKKGSYYQLAVEMTTTARAPVKRGYWG